MDKKGVTFVVVGIILVCLTFVILVVFFKQLSLFGSDLAEKQACRDSVVVKAKAGVIGDLANIDLSCKTQIVEIDVEKRDDLIQELADQLYWCWWQAGEGKLDYNFLVEVSDSGCVICSYISFSDKTKKINGGKILLRDFHDYLQNTKIPKKEVSYWDYFNQLNPDPDVAEIQKILLMERLNNLKGTEFYDLQKDYVVYFGAFPTDSLAKKIVRGGISITSGIVIGSIFTPFIGAASGAIIDVKLQFIFNQAIPHLSKIPIDQTDLFRATCDYVAN